MYGLFTQIAEITDYLYLSSANPVKSDRLHHMGITNVVNATIDVVNARVHNVDFLRVRVEDMPHANLGIYFDRVADHINQVHRRGGRVLVHCVAGVSRSASLCIAYLMKYQRMTLRKAYEHVKGRRQVIRPNQGFFKQLIDYERRLFGVNTVKMIPSGMGPIPDVYQHEIVGWRRQAAPVSRSSYYAARRPHVQGFYRPF